MRISKPTSRAGTFRISRLRASTPLLLGALVIGFVATPASAATVEEEWSMSVGPASLVTSDPGTSALQLQGSFTEVPGAVGNAIRFTYSGGPSLGVATSDVANPGTSSFAVGAYFKTDTVPTYGDFSPNVVQKGSFASGSQWKMQLKGGSEGTTAGCRFAGTGPNSGDIVKDSGSTKLDDGNWHEVVCWRESGQYGISVDGLDTSKAGDIGAISTQRSVRIANKGSWGGLTDQFQGTIDCVVYIQGSSARATAKSRVPC